jgi:predicted  nucleic acid-binding Zn-ribbon protein
MKIKDLNPDTVAIIVALAKLEVRIKNQGKQQDEMRIEMKDTHKTLYKKIDDIENDVTKIDQKYSNAITGAMGMVIVSLGGALWSVFKQ